MANDTEAVEWPFDVFISYARKDNQNGFVTELRNRLVMDAQSFSVRLEVFLDTDSIRDGDQWRERVLKALQQSKVLLVCLSPNFMASAECRREWDEYVKRETNTAPDARFVVWFVDLPGTDPDDSRAWREHILATNLTDFRPWYTQGADAFDDEEFGRLMGRLGQNVARKLEEHRRADQVPGNLSGRAEHFVGRSRELRQLHQLVGLGAQGSITVVHGLGGLGKTQLAVQYAHKHRGSFAAGVWQTDAEEATEFLPALGSLAIPLGVDAGGRDPREAGALVLAALHQRCLESPGSSALVLLDNVADPAMLSKAEIGEIPAVPWLSVVATTRIAPGDFADSPRLGFLTIEPLTEDASVELLEHFQPERAGSPAGAFPSEDERAAAQQVATLLGGFTLAVEQVAAFLRRNPARSVAWMRAALVGSGLVAADRLGDTVANDLLHRYKRIAVVLDQTLPSLEPAALTAVRYAALLPPGEIPWPWLELLTRTGHPELDDGDPFAPDPWTNVRRRLEGQQLLSPTNQPDVARMHRVIADHVSSRLTPQEREMTEAALAGLLAAWCDEIVRGRVFPSWVYGALAHAAIPRAARPELLRSIGNAVGHLACYVVDGSVLQIAHAQADHLRRLAAAQPGNLDAQRDLSVSLNNVARLEQRHDPAAALARYTESLDIRRALAAAQPGNLDAQRDLSVSLNNVARLEQRHDPAAALARYTESLDISRRLAAAQPGNLDAQRDLSVSLFQLAQFGLAFPELALDNDSVLSELVEQLSALGRRIKLDDASQQVLSWAKSRLGVAAASNPRAVSEPLDGMRQVIAPPPT